MKYPHLSVLSDSFHIHLGAVMRFCQQKMREMALMKMFCMSKNTPVNRNSFDLVLRHTGADTATRHDRKAGQQVH